MPNTLAHLGTGVLVTRQFDPRADLKWIFAGCVIPDVPWILQRVAAELPLHIDPYALRLYCICQASLMACAILSAGLAVISSQPWHVFLILAGNSALHLVLDACETKWGNGVHLFAPVSWRDINWELFWPESMVVTILSFFGLVYVVFDWFRGRSDPILLSLTPYPKLGLGTVLIALYFVIPLLLMQSAQQADCHFVKTLMELPYRQGLHVEFDRVRFESHEQHSVIHTFADEALSLFETPLDRQAVLSVQGQFINERTIRIDNFHVHNSMTRDGATILGLILVILCWVAPRSRFAAGSP